MKNVFPSLFKSWPSNEAEIVLVPFPDHEAVFPILFELGSLRCTSMLCKVLNEPLVECPFIFS